MSSKAAAALLRLKEIDEKYNKFKHQEDDKFSSESFNSVNEQSPRVFKPMLNIQMPETYVEHFRNYVSSYEGPVSSPIRIISSVKKYSDTENSADSGSQASKISQAGADRRKLVAESSEESEEEIEEELNSEIPEEGSEFVSRNDNTIEEVNGSSELPVESLGPREKILDFKSVISADEKTLERYSRDSFESDSSFIEEQPSSEAENEKETVKSEKSPQLLSNRGVPHSSDVPKDESESSIPSGSHSEEKSVTETTSKTADTKSNEKEKEQAVNESACINQHIPSSTVSHNYSEISEEVESAKDEEKWESEHSEDALERTSDSLLPTGVEVPSTSSAKADLKQEVQNEKRREEIHPRGSRKPKVITARKNGAIQREHRSISSVIAQYLQRIDEERQHSRVLPREPFAAPGAAYTAAFKPLELPKIAEFKRPVQEDQNCDPSVQILRSRLLDIRQWLKDQYSLYREQCELATSINKNYDPVNLVTLKKVQENQ